MKFYKNKQKKNILFYCPFVERGGIRTTLIKYANFLSKTYDVRLFTETKNAKMLSEFDKKIKIYHPKYTFNIKSKILKILGFKICKDDNDKDVTFIRILKDIAIFLSLNKEANQQSIIFSMSDHFVPLVFNKFTKNSKIIIRTAGIVPNHYNKEEYKYIKNVFLKKFIMRFYKLANLVITFSSQNVKYFKNLNIKSCCIYNNFEKQKTIKKLYKNRKLNIFFVGRFTYEKNVLFFLKNLKHNTNVNLHLVGDGEYTRQLKKEAAGKKNIFFHGFVKDPFKKYLNKIDLLSINSKHDGTPNVLGEAMSYGIPVIAPKNVGLANLFIGNDKYGYLYKSENSNSFKKKINLIIKNYIKALKKAKNGYHSIERFSKKNTHFRLLEEIEKL